MLPCSRLDTLSKNYASLSPCIHPTGYPHFDSCCYAVVAQNYRFSPVVVADDDDDNNDDDDGRQSIIF